MKPFKVGIVRDVLRIEFSNRRQTWFMHVTDGWKIELCFSPKGLTKEQAQEWVIGKNFSELCDMKPIGTMTAGEAYDKAVKKMSQAIGNNGHYFTMLGWKNPENGRTQGPILVTRDGDVIIEITRKGKFRDAFSAKAKCYYPWIDTEGGK